MLRTKKRKMRRWTSWEKKVEHGGGGEADDVATVAEIDGGVTARWTSIVDSSKRLL